MASVERHSRAQMPGRYVGHWNLVGSTSLRRQPYVALGFEHDVPTRLRCSLLKRLLRYTAFIDVAKALEENASLKFTERSNLYLLVRNQVGQ